MPELLQEYLFHRIREKLRPTDSLVDVVASLLFVSNDSAYRRIRGETGLVLEEARILCDHFHLSLDELLGSKPNTISFSYKRLENGTYDFEQYLFDIKTNLQMAAGGEIIYLTKDIPVFYNFLFRPLFAFRYFFWMKSILQHPDFVNQKFSFSFLPPEMEKTGSEIVSLYNQISSVEIWNTECVNSTISQVEYYREAGYFQSEEDIHTIYSSVADLLEHLRRQADCGSKFIPGEKVSVKKENLHFFYNRLVLGENTIIVKKQGKAILYLAYDVLNYMVTLDESFVSDTLQKVNNLMRRSTLLSSANEKQRNIFFNLLLRKIPDSGNYIKSQA